MFWASLWASDELQSSNCVNHYIQDVTKNGEMCPQVILSS